MTTTYSEVAERRPAVEEPGAPAWRMTLGLLIAAAVLALALLVGAGHAPPDANEDFSTITD